MSGAARRGCRRRRYRLYGSATLADITPDVDATAGRLWVHDYQSDVDGYVVTPAGLSSYGYPWLDALRDTGRPYAVVHISQWHAHDGRERTDVFAPTATVDLAGARWRGYSLAVEALVHHLRGE